jgi:endonuclease YncB( thermonuclease family)
MKPASAFLIVASLCLPALTFGKMSDSDWQSGVVKRISTNHVSKSSGHFGQKPPKHGVFLTYYFVQTNDHLYEAEEIQTKPTKAATLAVDQHVKFVINGTTFVVKDQKGKQHKFRLLNSIQEPVSQAAAPNAVTPK